MTSPSHPHYYHGMLTFFSLFNKIAVNIQIDVYEYSIPLSHIVAILLLAAHDSHTNDTVPPSSSHPPVPLTHSPFSILSVTIHLSHIIFISAHHLPAPFHPTFITIPLHHLATIHYILYYLSPHLTTFTTLLPSPTLPYPLIQSREPKLDEEALEEYKDAFNMFDKNKDGRIDTTELAGLMRHMGHNLTGIEFNDIVNECGTFLFLSLFLFLLLPHSPPLSFSLHGAHEANGP